MKLKNFLSRIPRSLKACVCTVLVVLLALTYYIALGCPTLSFRQEFRRAEKAHLVGPSKIIDTLNGEYIDFDKMIVGETEYGICFFGRYYNAFPYDNPFAEKQYLFSYVEKSGDVTIAAAPNVWGSTWALSGIMRYVPVYLFTDEPNSVRAEVEITVVGAYNNGTAKDRIFTEIFVGEAERSEEGFFRFGLSADDDSSLHALHYLSSKTGGFVFNERINESLQSITAVVRLYDANGALVQEKELTIYG